MPHHDEIAQLIGLVGEDNWFAFVVSEEWKIIAAYCEEQIEQDRELLLHLNPSDPIPIAYCQARIIALQDILSLPDKHAEEAKMRTLAR